MYICVYIYIYIYARDVRWDREKGQSQNARSPSSSHDLGPPSVNICRLLRNMFLNLPHLKVCLLVWDSGLQHVYGK